MKEIRLSRGLVSMVDDEDYEFLSLRKWYAHQSQPGRFYAANRMGGAMLYMHRLLIPGAAEVDHIDRDTLNNRRANLRPATHVQNSHNKAKLRGTTSRFKGVSWCKRTGRWQAHIYANGKSTFLGRYRSDVDAALAYNEAAKGFYGEFAAINQVEQESA